MLEHTDGGPGVGHVLLGGGERPRVDAGRVVAGSLVVAQRGDPLGRPAPRRCRGRACRRRRSRPGRSAPTPRRAATAGNGPLPVGSVSVAASGGDPTVVGIWRTESVAAEEEVDAPWCVEPPQPAAATMIAAPSDADRIRRTSWMSSCSFRVATWCRRRCRCRTASRASVEARGSRAGVRRSSDAPRERSTVVGGVQETAQLVRPWVDPDLPEAGLASELGDVSGRHVLLGHAELLDGASRRLVVAVPGFGGDEHRHRDAGLDRRTRWPRPRRSRDEGRRSTERRRTPPRRATVRHEQPRSAAGSDLRRRPPTAPARSPRAPRPHLSPGSRPWRAASSANRGRSRTRARQPAERGAATGSHRPA